MGFQKLSELKPKKLDYLGVSYGLTNQLYRFWQKCGFRPAYLSQVANSLTGEHTCIMINALKTSEDEHKWEDSFFNEFIRRFTALLGNECFKKFKPATALQILHCKSNEKAAVLTKAELDMYFSQCDLEQLKLFENRNHGYHRIVHTLPDLAKLYFSNKVTASLTFAQKAILIGMGFQRKDIDVVAKDMKDMDHSGVLGQLTRLVRNISKKLQKINDDGIAAAIGLPTEKDVKIKPALANSDDDDEEETNSKPTKEYPEINKKFDIDGTEEDWEEASKNRAVNGSGIVSVKINNNKRPAPEESKGAKFATKQKKRKHGKSGKNLKSRRSNWRKSDKK